MGADHTAGYTIATNILKVGGFVDPLTKEGQVELSRNLQIATTAVDSTGMCIFVAFPALDIPEVLPALADMIGARFGVEMSVDDFVGLGARILKMEKAFNTAAGFTAEDDRLPEFFELRADSSSQRGMGLHPGRNRRSLELLKETLTCNTSGRPNGVPIFFII